MILKDIYLYFAEFPASNGLLDIATLEREPLYTDYREELSLLTRTELCPEIAHYLYGQTLEDIQQRLDRLQGTFLFVDYGEIELRPAGRGSVEGSMQVAVTVAEKLSDLADLLERLDSSDRMLRHLTSIHQVMRDDSESAYTLWLERTDLTECDFVPFVAPELHSYGWTMMFTCHGINLANHEPQPQRTRLTVGGSPIGLTHRQPQVR